MKKILLSLFLFISFSFGDVDNYLQPKLNGNYYSTTFNLCLKKGSQVSTGAGGIWGYLRYDGNTNKILDQTTSTTLFFSATFVPLTDCIPCTSPNVLSNTTCTAPLIPTCTANQYLENNVCINQPTCELGTTLNTTTHTCTIDFPIASTDYLEGGGVLLHYEDNKIMLLRRDGTAESWDLETGQYFFPNRAFEGVVPPSASYNPLSFNPSEPIQYKELTVGDFVAFEFNQMGIALKDASKFLTAPALLWTFGLSTKKETPDNIVLTQSSSISGTSISASTTNTPNIDFSEYENTATSTPQTIPNTDIQVQKITTPPNPKDPNNWAGAGSTIKGYTGVATVGDVVATSASNPNTAFIDTPTEVKIVQQKPDGSIDATIFNKQDLKNTATNETLLPVKQINVTPEKMANDGTFSQQQTTQQSTIVPSTNQNLATDKSTGLPEIVDYNPRDGLKDGNLYSTITGGIVGAGTGTPAGISPTAPVTPAPAGGTGSIDLSGVTSRLDKISNQFNKLLTDVDAPASDIPATAHTIPTTVPSGLLSWETSWNEAKNSLNSVTEKSNQLKSLFQNGFTFSLTGGTITTCPYSSNLDLGYTSKELSFDFCKTLSPLRPITYTFFYLFFVFLVLSFSFKLILRMV